MTANPAGPFGPAARAAGPAGSHGTTSSTVVRTCRHVTLCSVTPADYQDIHAALNDPTVALTWRTRGASVGVADLERAIFEGATLTLIAKSFDGDPCGVVQLLDIDPVDRVADLAVLAFPTSVGTGLIAEAAAVFIDECFHRFNIRKVYASLSQGSSDALGSIDSLFTLEGKLRSHVWLDGGFKDVTVYGVLVEEFARNVARSNFWKPMSSDGWRVFDRFPPDDAPEPGDLSEDLTVLLGAPLASLDPAANLVDDLDLDSLDLLELRGIIEEAVGHPIVDDAFASVQAVGDVIGLLEAFRVPT